MKVLEYSPKHKLQCYEGPKVEVRVVINMLKIRNCQLFIVKR